MSWNTVDDKHKKKYDRNFVSCDEKYERDFIIQIILEVFPYLSRPKVEAAVDHCCRTILRHDRGKGIGTVSRIS